MLVLPADMARGQADACLRMLVQGLPRVTAGSVEVDAGALERFDSSALAVLRQLRRKIMAQGRTLAIRALPQGLRDLAKVYGIEELLPAA